MNGAGGGFVEKLVCQSRLDHMSSLKRDSGKKLNPVGNLQCIGSSKLNIVVPPKSGDFLFANFLIYEELFVSIPLNFLSKIPYSQILLALK